MRALKKTICAFIVLAAIFSLGYFAGYMAKNDRELIELTIEQNELIDSMYELIQEQDKLLVVYESMDSFYVKNLSLLDEIIGAKE